MKRCFFFIVLFNFHLINSQELQLEKLSETIFQFNNNLQYKKSQDTLVKLLEQENLKAKDRIEVYILLSHTYKRLQDYASVIYYLSNAKNISEENKLFDLAGKIDAEFAYAYFDTQDYTRADEIMRKISARNYKYLDQDNKGKILMQEGYIEYRKNNYKKADQYYIHALSVMKKSSPCDIPIVYGKEIQLHFAQNNEKRAFEYYDLGIKKAKECNIMKYQMYLAEVMMNIYKEKKDVENAFKYTQKYDSLIAIYKPEENMQALHLSRENKAQENEKKVNKSKFQITLFYSTVTFILLLLLFLIVRYSLNLKNKNREHAKIIDKMKQTLMKYENEISRNITQKSKLNSKQLLMLEMIKDGKSNKEIANHFNISESTVKYHIKNIYEILNIKRRSHLKAETDFTKYTV